MNLQSWYRKQGFVGMVWLRLITFSTIVIASCANEFLPAVAQKQRADGVTTPSKALPVADLRNLR